MPCFHHLYLASWLSSTFQFSRFSSVTQLGVDEEEEDDDVEIAEANRENENVEDNEENVEDNEENVEDNEEDADDETHHNWTIMAFSTHGRMQF